LRLHVGSGIGIPEPSWDELNHIEDEKMKSYISVDLPPQREYFKHYVEIELDNNWKRKRKDYPELVLC